MVHYGDIFKYIIETPFGVSIAKAEAVLMRKSQNIRKTKMKTTIKTDGAYLKDASKRITADITDDIGKVIRIGSMNDINSFLDVGSLISRDFQKAIIIMRSFKDNQLHSYDMDCTNSTTYDADDTDFKKIAMILKANKLKGGK
jgi:predicted phosphatase